MARVLLTGANGFIGRHALGHLLQEGFEVHAVSTQQQVAHHPSLHWHQADLLDAIAVRHLVAQVLPEQLLHLAWCAKPGAYWTSSENLQWVRATLDLLEAFHALGGKHAVLVGSCAEYDWRYGYCREDITPLLPGTVYGRCKSATRELAEVFSQVHELPIAWGRIFNAYGPYEAPQRLVPSVLNALLRGKAAACTHGEQIRDFLHAADVASALIVLLQAQATGSFNIASGQPVRLRDVVEHLARRLDAMDLLQLGTLQVPANDPPLLLADNQRLLALGWRARFDLVNGLDDALAWWRERI